MARYRPSKPFNVPLLLFPIISTSYVKGVLKKVYAPEGILFHGSFVTFGGTEREINGLMVIEDTATVETWYRPEFKANCRVAFADDPDAIYEILGTPENIERANQFCKFRLRRIQGGA